METENKNMPSIERPDHRGNHPSTPQLMRNVFGIFMILVYVGMGIALFCNAFRWDADFTWARIICGVLLVIYGVWRGYRQFTGLDSNI